MERVIKRYFMHNQGDSDDLKQNEYDDLRTELQLMKFDMLNDLKCSRDDTEFSMNSINTGMEFVSEEILNCLINKYKLNDNQKDNQIIMNRLNDYLNRYQCVSGPIFRDETFFIDNDSMDEMDLNGIRRNRFSDKKYSSSKLSKIAEESNSGIRKNSVIVESNFNQKL